MRDGSAGLPPWGQWLPLGGEMEAGWVWRKGTHFSVFLCAFEGCCVFVALLSALTLQPF